MSLRGMFYGEFYLYFYLLLDCGDRLSRCLQALGPQFDFSFAYGTNWVCRYCSWKEGNSPLRYYF